MHTWFRSRLAPGLSLTCLLIGLNSLSLADETGGPLLVDSALESVTHLGVAPVGGTLEDSTQWLPERIDYMNRQVGDFSLTYLVAGSPEHVGLTPGPYVPAWDLTDRVELRFWARSKNADVQAISFVLLDASGNVAELDGALPVDDAWHALSFDLSGLSTGQSFDVSKVVAVQTTEPLASGARLWLDGAAFFGGPASSPLGITDMTYGQRIAQAAATLDQRVERAFRKAARSTKTEKYLFKEFAKLWLNEDLDEVNARLLEIFTTEDEQLARQYEVHNDWSLWLTPMMNRMYFNFSSQSTIKPGRLYPETEKALLELLWEREKKTNDIALTRKSTWWMIGSENHDINSKVSSLLSSQIFSQHPDFASRIYPNLGKGGGSGYWFHSMYGKGGRYHGPEGEADWSDGGEYNSADHRDAWVTFWKEYIRERVKKGFFLEVASPGYMEFTVTFLQDIHDYSDDPELQQLAGEFLDLIWLEWSQDQISSMRGGSKTRWRDRPLDSLFRASRFYLGGEGEGDGFLYSILTSDYQWPDAVWQMALDRQGKGEFAYISRKPGEEQVVWPRPAGLERTMMCDTESRFVRYSWVTPDYIMGTQMDHPGAVHSHLSPQRRWQGINFAGDGKDWIGPCSLDISNADKWDLAKELTLYRNMQHENVMISQQARRFSQQNPDWYPEKNLYSPDSGVRIGGQKDGDVIEKNGWIFVDRGHTYVGIRPVRAGYVFSLDTWTKAGSETKYIDENEEQYQWGPNKEFIRLADPYSPVIMQAGRKEIFGTFEKFIQHMDNAKVLLKATVVPGWFILEYMPVGDDGPHLEFNASNSAIPRLNGQSVDYAPKAVLNSPFIHAEYGSGVVEVNVGDERQVIDVRKP